MDTRELLLTALRALGVYALVLVVIRVLGKRTVGNFTAFDLLVALMLGEIVDEVIYGDVTFAQGGVAILVIAAAHYANSWMSYWDHGLARILEGSPTAVVRRGELDRGGMRKERMNESEVMEALRVQGVDDVKEVKLAMVENDGQVSVLKEEWAQPLRKGDLG
jgi:uncharacterized membrane protein YcaP (DUF421 family)